MVINLFFLFWCIFMFLYVYLSLHLFLPYCTRIYDNKISIYLSTVFNSFTVGPIYVTAKCKELCKRCMQHSNSMLQIFML